MLPYTLYGSSRVTIKGEILMFGSLNLFEKFMPHGVCYQWRADILWLNVISDTVIAFAYFFIPSALIYFLRKKGEVPFTGVIYMFCVFIFACGLTHVLSIFTVWTGQYALQGTVKALTALASAATAIMLYPVMPKLLALRSPKELEETNVSLQEQIEQRKTSEAQSIKLQGDLARLGRITTVGQMATGLAHELNQPLLAISACADTAVLRAKKTSSDAVLFDCLDDIQAETQRAGAIIRALRQFISNKSSAWSAVDLNDLVEQAVRLMSGEARNADVQIVVNNGKVQVVTADNVQIAQVLVNLIRNAIEAISEVTDGQGSTQNVITITTGCDGEMVVVEVRDTGPGIAPGIDPFAAFETNKVDGLGVGLSISRDIIEAHGGKLAFKRLSGEGVGFIFSLPKRLPENLANAPVQ